MSSSESGNDDLFRPDDGDENNQTEQVDSQKQNGVSGDSKTVDESKASDASKDQEDDNLFDADSSDDEVAQPKQQPAESSASDDGEKDLLQDTFGPDESDEEELEPIVVNKGFSLPTLPRPSKDATVRGARIPTFLTVARKAFDVEEFKKETQDSSKSDSVMQNAIRWRYKTDKDGNRVLDQSGEPVLESNTRFVQWSDGSWQVMVGSEVFDVKGTKPSTEYVFTKTIDENMTDSTIMECHARIQEEIKFRPSSLSSRTHKQLELQVQSKSLKQVKIREMQTIVDPEKEQEARAKAVEDRLRLEQRQRSKREFGHNGRGSAWDSSFMEEGSQEDRNSSVRALKQGARNRRGTGGRSGGRSGKRRQTKRSDRIFDSDESDEEDEWDHADDDEESDDGEEEASVGKSGSDDDVKPKKRKSLKGSTGDSDSESEADTKKKPTDNNVSSDDEDEDEDFGPAKTRKRTRMVLDDDSD